MMDGDDLNITKDNTLKFEKFKTSRRKLKVDDILKKDADNYVPPAIQVPIKHKIKKSKNSRIEYLRYSILYLKSNQESSNQKKAKDPMGHQNRIPKLPQEARNKGSYWNYATININRFLPIMSLLRINKSLLNSATQMNNKPLCIMQPTVSSLDYEIIKNSLDNRFKSTFNVNHIYDGKLNINETFQMIKRYFIISYNPKCIINSPVIISIRLIKDDQMNLKSKELIELIMPKSVKFIKFTVVIIASNFEISTSWKFFELPIEEDSDEINFFLYPFKKGKENVQIELFHNETRIFSLYKEIEIL